MRAPDFWSGDGPLARFLEPFSLAWAAGSAWRWQRGQASSWRAPVPVICLGNVVTGGAGKTPLAIDLLRRLPGAHGLLRGYGGREKGPLQVDLRRHGFQDVGDEALLLAAVAPTWISARRAEGARAAIAAGAQMLVMDDGFQNPSLYKDLPLLVIDGGYGFGNGRVLPAGPLREPLAAAWQRLEESGGAVVLMGEDRQRIRQRIPAGVPLLTAEVRPDVRSLAATGKPVVAFAGIGRPEKFFASLRQAGLRVVATHPFADHYPYAPTDIQPILDEAWTLGAVPVTTAKDAVRLSADQRQQVDVVGITVHWHDEAAVQRLLAPFLSLTNAGCSHG